MKQKNIDGIGFIVYFTPNDKKRREFLSKIIKGKNLYFCKLKIKYILKDSIERIENIWSLKKHFQMSTKILNIIYNRL